MSPQSVAPRVSSLSALKILENPEQPASPRRCVGSHQSDPSGAADKEKKGKLPQHQAKGELANRQHQCPLCVMTFASEDAMISHTQRHTKFGDLADRPGTTLPLQWLQNYGRISCSDCHQHFKKNGGLISHQRHCQKKAALLRADLSLAQAEAHASVDPEAFPAANLDSPLDEDVDQLPSLNEVLALNVPTIKYIPMNARQHWADTLTRHLNKASFENTETAWTLLFMLPKCILLATQRGGKKRKKTPISLLCDLWAKGKWRDLWERAKAAAKPSRITSDRAAKNELLQAALFAEEGLYGKAVAALQSDGLAPDSETTKRQLQEKHPEVDQPHCPMDYDGAAALVDEAKQGDTLQSSVATGLDPKVDVLQQLRSFSRSTAGGPSGFRVQHLLDAADAPSTFLSALRNNLNVWLSGKIPETLSIQLAGGLLVALRKVKPGAEDDVRPIAIGEILRRLAAKCALASIHDEARVFFKPHQSFLERPGAEAIVHRVRSRLAGQRAVQGNALLKIDFKNAFNLVSRQAVLDECAKRFPSILPFVSWCYLQRPILRHRLGPFWSCSGVQQGDPLGPFLFSLVLQVLVAEIESSPRCTNLEIHEWYLDDGILFGPASEVAAALEIIGESGRNLGLQLNLAKCELFSTSAANFELFPAEIVERSESYEFSLLGAPIGSDVFCASFADSKLKKVKEVLPKLVEMHHPQAALHMLRSCLSFGKVNHLARCTPSSPQFVKKMRELDDAVRGCLETIIRPGAQLEDASWLQAQLGLAQGGLGLRSAERHCAAAYVGSSTQSLRPRAKQGVASLPVSENGLPIGPEPSVDLKQAVSVYSTFLGKEVSADAVKRYASVGISQSALSDAVEKIDAVRLRKMVDEAARTRLDSEAAKWAAAWLLAKPCRAMGLLIDEVDMMTLLQFWLGERSRGAEFCARCKSPMDRHGHHAVTCKFGGNVSRRHNALRDCFFKFCKQARITASKERGANYRDKTRPADILLSPSFGSLQFVSDALDFAVTSPHIFNPVGAGGGSEVSLSQVSFYEQEKHRLNSPKCSELNWRVVPMVVSTFGEWGEEAQPIFKYVADELAVCAGSKVPRGSVLASIYARMGVQLMKANAMAIRSCGGVSVGSSELLNPVAGAGPFLKGFRSHL